MSEKRSNDDAPWHPLPRPMTTEEIIEHGRMRLDPDYAARKFNATIDTLTAQLAAAEAEVLRLRERDAAWEWLARWVGGASRRGVGFDCNGVMAATSGSDGDETEYEVAALPPSDKPDPVALATALGWKGEMA